MPLFRFCPQCGSALPAPSAPPERVLQQDCPSCGAVHYRNAKPTAGALIVRDGKVLLGRRAVEPFYEWWDIPGGFLEPWEEPAEGVVREIREETGLLVTPTELLAVYVDTYGDSGDYTLNFYYLVRDGGGEPCPPDDVTALAWFAADALPERVAFASGRRALDTWCRRLAAK